MDQPRPRIEVKWPALVLIAVVMLAMLGRLAPNVPPPRFRWLTVGGIVTLLAVAIVSFGFGLYVANFGSYDKTYGTLGGVIAFLSWLYLVNGAVLFGVEINAEVQRGRALQAGQPDDDPVLPPWTAADDAVPTRRRRIRLDRVSGRTRRGGTPPPTALVPTRGQRSWRLRRDRRGHHEGSQTRRPRCRQT